jgi:type IV pilus assembly protein PilB
MPDTLSISKLLLDKKLISDDQFALIQSEYSKTGKQEDEIIKKLNFVSEEEVVKAKGELYNIPFVKLKEVGSAPEVLEFISKSVAEKYVLIPFSISLDQKELKVAFANPFDLGVVEFIEAKSGKTVVPYIAMKDDILTSINERYSQNLTAEVSSAIKEISDLSENKEIKVDQNGKLTKREPISEIVTEILKFAISYRASDVHIEPEEDKTRIRYRIDGILQEKLVLSKTVHEALVSRIKVLSELKIDEKRLPQDGRFTFKANNQEVDLRVSTLPTVYGEKIVMRLLKKSGGVPTLQELGLRGRALSNLQESILKPHGIILICGPTGSGKTTTLYSLLTIINTPKVNIVTLEDPVEYQIAGINQVQVNPAAGLTFASGLRAFLRQDPNIIMVGEIRDKETLIWLFKRL